MRFLKSFKAGKCKDPSDSIPLEYAVARRKMVDEQLRRRGIEDERVLQVMFELPRHLFVEEALVSQAYQDTPLNIGFSQTISQPFMVALLAQSLQLSGSEKVLEIGTGCGYQTAVIARLAQKVYSIERLGPLLMKARKHLKQLGIRNVVLRLGDGSLGWPDQAPFQAIIVAAVAPEQAPQPLLDQLGDGGRLVLPIARENRQYLVRVLRFGDHFQEEILGECRFVPMIGKFGFKE